MPPLKSPFQLDLQPEVFSSSAQTSAAIHRAVKDGRARRVSRSLFTRNLNEPLEQVVQRNWAAVAAHHVPGGVLVDRSAIEARPSADGSLFLDAGPEAKGPRTYEAPGLSIKARPGPGPLDGDMPHMNGLYFSSRARALLDNMRPSRARSGVARTLSQAEFEEHLAHISSTQGPDALNRLRDEARDIARETEEEGLFERLDGFISAIQGTRDAELSTPTGIAAARGQAYDPQRVALFETLQAALLREPLPSRAQQPGSWVNLAFMEAYFSNRIEGTEFELDEAEEIVFKRAVPAERFEDAHDILGTFDLANDPVRRSQLPNDGDEFLALLLAHHGAVLERRPSANPGQFKIKANRAGQTTFVMPDLAAGTLLEGYRHLQAVPEGLPRAIFFQFLVSEVHPFTDGNGRLARIMMNAELSAAEEHRIIIPIVYRDDYIQSLRGLSRNANPTPLLRVLDIAQDYTSRIDWSTLDGAEQTLRDTHAFLEPSEADELGVRLVLPER